ncbi:MAG: RNA methyltransferase [Candidatus Zixiibacteriota bacterium]
MSITKSQLKSIKALSTSKGRKQTGLFVAEGVRLIEEAVRHRIKPVQLYFAPSLLSERGKALVEEFGRKKITMFETSARELNSMSATQTPQGIIAAFSIPDCRLAQLYRPNYRKILWCENISDPGNLGTLARSALAFGFDPVILTGNSADPWSPKVVRASAGAIFGLHLTRETTDEALAFADRNKFAIVATGVKGKKLDYSLKKQFEKAKLILAVGSEADGLSEEVKRKAGLFVRIDHSGEVESLNAAVAGSILMNMLYEGTGAGQ